MVNDWRKVIEGHLRRPLSGLEWAGLVAEGYEEELDDGSLALDELLAKHFPGGAGHAPPAGKWSIDQPVNMPDALKRRGTVLAKLYAQLAAKVSDVRRIRSEIGDLPSETDLPRWLERFYCEAWGVAGLDEVPQARVKAWDDGESEVVDFVNPLPAKQPPCQWWELRDVPVPAASWAGTVAGTVDKLAGDWHWHPEQAARWLICGGPVPNVIYGTVRHRMDGTSLYDLPGWERGGATLTRDEQEAARRLHREPTDTRWRITITIDPIYTPGEVAQLYAAARAAISPERVRRMTDKGLALAEFLLDQPEEWPEAGEGGGTWRTWLGRWNAGPGAQHGTYSPADRVARSNFRRDALGAGERLRYAGWRPLRC